MNKPANSFREAIREASIEILRREGFDLWKALRRAKGLSNAPAEYAAFWRQSPRRPAA
jgi:hypothetical protein